MNELPEILLIDKPKGITSFDVIRRLQWKYRDDTFKNFLGFSLDLSAGRGASDVGAEDVHGGTLTGQTNAATKSRAKSKLKAGHAGTLDPLATGLMIIGVGKGTKQLTQLVKLDKEYIAEIRVGERRSTGDMEGEILEEKAVEEIFSEEKISSTLTDMLGTLRLPVSAYSAIKKDGVPMYKRARAAEKKGELVTEVPLRDMDVQEVELLSAETAVIDEKKRLVVTTRFKVGSGTYVRSLAEEFGTRLGYPATLQNLRRTKVGEFDVEDAYMLDEV